MRTPGRGWHRRGMSRLRRWQSNGSPFRTEARRRLKSRRPKGGAGSGARWWTVLTDAFHLTLAPFSSLADQLGPHTGQHRVGEAPPDQVHQD